MPRFYREVFYSGPAEYAVIKDMFLKSETRPFGGMKVIGDASNPMKVELYKSAKPEYNEHPFAVYEQDDEGTLVDPAAEVAAPPPVIRRRKT